MNTFDSVKALVVETLGCEENDVTLETNLKDDLGADSLTAVEMIMVLEDEFDIMIPEEASRDIETVGDLVNLVQSLL
ncbi:MAG: acyl carrier protein [Clostridiales bacterium]|jgi:acyl carrier protein|nr:acyl carrier protein [Clostridiales bacterium]